MSYYQCVVFIFRIAANCNGKKNAAKKASEMSTELYLKLYLEKNGPIKARAVVIDVKERFFEVIDLSTRTLGRIYVDVSYANGIPKTNLGVHIIR